MKNIMWIRNGKNANYQQPISLQFKGGGIILVFSCYCISNSITCFMEAHSANWSEILVSTQFLPSDYSLSIFGLRRHITVAYLGISIPGNHFAEKWVFYRIMEISMIKNKYVFRKKKTHSKPTKKMPAKHLCGKTNNNL